MYDYSVLSVYRIRRGPHAGTVADSPKYSPVESQCSAVLQVLRLSQVHDSGTWDLGFLV